MINYPAGEQHPGPSRKPCQSQYSPAADILLVIGVRQPFVSRSGFVISGVQPDTHETAMGRGGVQAGPLLGLGLRRHDRLPGGAQRAGLPGHVSPMLFVIGSGLKAPIPSGYFCHTCSPGSDSGSPVAVGTTLLDHTWVAGSSASILSIINDMNARGGLGAGFTLAPGR
ncbi:hypothetical protein [Saccharopolyspora sp. NPDC050642]|uniref:hypothetical protein n=1 Tax=Saccharopolyspora sp. NPDC050642 TaxID=3157099 RepID=UPI0033F1C5C7